LHRAHATPRCQPHDIPVLVSARLLKPLSNPQPNSVKYLASMEVLELAKGRARRLGRIGRGKMQQRNKRRFVALIILERDLPGWSIY
jgi:hypothetical protein